jgi:hypothetical protein
MSSKGVAHCSSDHRFCQQQRVADGLRLPLSPADEMIELAAKSRKVVALGPATRHRANVRSGPIASFRAFAWGVGCTLMTGRSEETRIADVALPCLRRIGALGLLGPPVARGSDSVAAGGPAAAHGRQPIARAAFQSAVPISQVLS